MKKKYIRQFLRPPTPEGFTLLEATIAIFILGTAMLLNLPFVVLFQQQNITQQAKLDASGFAKDSLEKFRSQILTDASKVDPVIGRKDKKFSDPDPDDPKATGFQYTSTTYVCTARPIVDEIDPDPKKTPPDEPPVGATEHLSDKKYMGVKTCSTDTTDDKNIRYIVIQVSKDEQTAPLHTVQTVYVPLGVDDNEEEE